MPASLFRSIARFAAEERALVSSTAGSLIVRLAGMAATFAFGVLLARLLNPQGFGTYGIIVAIALVLSVVGQFGLQTVGMREISVALAQQRWGELRGYVGNFFMVVLGMSAALAALWAAIVLAFPTLLGPQDANLAGVLLVPIFALTVLVSAELRALDRIVTGQALEILIRPAIMCVLLVGLVMVQWTLTPAIAVGVLAVSGAGALAVGLVWLRSAVPLPARRAQTVSPHGWRGAAIALAAVDMLKQLDVTYGILLLGALSSEAEAGYFRVALSTIIFVAMPLSIFNVVLAPSLARLHSEGDRRRLQHIMTISAATMFATSVAALLLIAFAGKFLITWVFGESYAPSWLPLLLLTAAQAINGFFGVGWVLLSMSGAERRLTGSYIVSVAVSIIAAVPLTISFGAAGAAAAAIVGALIQNLLAWHGVRLHSSLESSAAGLLLRWRTAAPQEPS